MTRPPHQQVFLISITHVCLWRRFGNRVSNPLSQAAFAAEGTGPGRLTAAIVQCSDAELAVNYSADVAGRYSLAVRCRATGEVRNVDVLKLSISYVRVSAPHDNGARAPGHLRFGTMCMLCRNYNAHSHEQVLKGSPFALGISPAPADPAKCVASLDGAVGSGRRVEAGKELLVTVQLRDRFGNITQQAGAPVVAVLKIDIEEGKG